MKALQPIAIFLSVIWLGSFLAPRAKADAWDELTKMTFSQPVEVPGQVLPPGTYWFRLMDSPSDRDIVQIMNADQDKSLAIILAIPDYHLQPAGKTILTFEERAANSPEAIREWVYPGDNYGHEFVYPKPRAMQLAKASNQTVLSMPAALEANTRMTVKSSKAAPVVALKQAPVKAEQPSGTEVEIAAVLPPKPAPSTTAPAQPVPLPATLPQTASPMPLVGLIGFTLASAGLLLGFTARRPS